MPLRLVEIALPADAAADLRELLRDDESVIELWRDAGGDAAVLLRVLLPAEKTEKLLDELDERLGGREEFRVVILPVEATLPRYDLEEGEPEENAAGGVAKEGGEGATEDRESGGAEEKQEEEGEEEEERFPLRVSREELFAEITDGMKLSSVFLALVVLSTIVAAVGLLRSNVAVVIGAMVIAPLLGPNVGLAFATTLGDLKLGLRALKTNLYGVSLAFALSATAGLLLKVDPTVSEIASRTEIHLSDIVLALASGSAGVLAFTSGISSALIGVMVAVALLPPLVALGLLVGAGHFHLAWKTLLLLLTNLICVNLAGVTTFVVQGVRPRTWWKAHRARRATRWALALWSALLLLLAAIIYVS